MVRLLFGLFFIDYRYKGDVTTLKAAVYILNDFEFFFVIRQMIKTVLSDFLLL